MRVFITGASGAIGKSLVPKLVANGHEVTGTTSNPRKMAQQFGPTNRLRSEGTDNLLEAAGAVGARMVAQSFAGWPFAREGGPVKDEDAPLDDHPPAAMRDILAAIRHLESAVV